MWCLSGCVCVSVCVWCVSGVCVMFEWCVCVWCVRRVIGVFVCVWCVRCVSGVWVVCWFFYTYIVILNLVPFLALFSICEKQLTVNFNHLKPTGYVMHHPFNIQQLYALPTLYLCVLYLSENKQRLVPLTA